MPDLVTSYGTWSLPAAWDGDNGLDFRETDTVNDVQIIRLYAPAYALLLETQDQAARVAGAGFSLRYGFDTGTSDADPGAGNLRFDNATVTSATQIFVDDLDAGGSDRTGILALFDDSTSTVKGQISVNKLTDSTAWLTGDLTVTVDASGYYKLTISNVSASSGAPFTAGDAVVLGFVRNGDKGEAGSVNGGTLSSDIDGDNAFTLINLPNPDSAQKAATKAYVDAAHGENIRAALGII